MESIHSIGILGAGDVGKTLAKGFQAKGFDVMIATRNPAHLVNWQLKNNKISIGTFEEASVMGEILVLAVRGSGGMSCLDSCGEENLRDKLVIDATNPVGDEPPVDGVLPYFKVEGFQSLMESYVHAFPFVNFVKGLNAGSVSNLVDPSFRDGKPTVMICGNNMQSKEIATELIHLLGHEVQDLGPAVCAELIEPLYRIWYARGLRNGLWGHALKILTNE